MYHEYLVHKTENLYNTMLKYLLLHLCASLVLDKLLQIDLMTVSYTHLDVYKRQEICHRAHIDGDRNAGDLTPNEADALYGAFTSMMDLVRNGQFSPNVVFRNHEPLEFSCVPLTCYGQLEHKTFDTMSQLLEYYYAMKNTITRIRQKSSDLRRVVNNALDRTRKKYQLQLKQMEDTKKREKYKIYGELINTYGYELEPEAKSLTCQMCIRDRS